MTNTHIFANYNLSKVIMNPEMQLENNLGKDLKNLWGGKLDKWEIELDSYLSTASESLHTHPESLPLNLPFDGFWLSILLTSQGIVH